MGITIRGNGLKSNTPNRMGKAKFLNNKPTCKHGVEIVLCGPCWSAQRNSQS